MSSPEIDLNHERTRRSNSYSSYKTGGHRRFPSSGGEAYRGDKGYTSQKYNQSSRESRDDARPQVIASNFPLQANEDAIRDDLFYELKKFGEVTISIRGNGDDRVAFVNFRNPQIAYDLSRYYQDHHGKMLVCDRVVQFDFDFDQDGPTDFSPQSQGGSPRRTYRQSKPKFDTSHSRGDRNDVKGPRFNNHNPYNSRFNNNNKRRYEEDTTTARSRSRGPYNDNGQESYRSNTEDDPRATRTLFVGNLEPSTEAIDLRKVFDRYGSVEEIDVKRPSHPQGGTYAFVKFADLDTAAKAKLAMTDQYIGRNMCKIGYGKSVPSTRLWVGGLGPWTSLEELTREFDRFGAIRRIDYEKGNDYGYVLFDSQDAASVAAREMKGYILAGTTQKLTIDFASTDEKREVHDPNVHANSANKYNKNHYSASAPSEPKRNAPPKGSHYQPMDSYKQYDRKPPYRPNQGKDWHDNSRSSHFDRESSRDSPDGLLARKRPRRAQSPGSYSHDSFDGPAGKHNAKHNNHEPDVPARHHRNDNSAYPPDDRTKRGDVDRRQRLSQSGELSDPGVEHKKTSNGEKAKQQESKEADSKQDGSRAESLLDLAKRFAVAWRGTFVLRNSVFPVRMHLIGGNPELADCFLRSGASSGSSVKALNITQRLRLDQPKLEEVSRRINTAGASGHCILLALPAAQQGDDSDSSTACQPRPLRSLVTYFKQKQAAGVIPMPVVVSDSAAANASGKEEPGILHAFPPCEYSHQQLLKVSPNLGPEPSKEDHLVVVLVRGV